MTAKCAYIVLIGDELLAGELADRNGPWLAEQLTAQGFSVQRLEIIPDQRDIILKTIDVAMQAGDLVVVCGGLGPTSDDLTSEAVAAALGEELVLDEAQWERIQQMFMAFRGEGPPPGNEKQAMIPASAQALPNAHGTAIGYALSTGNGAALGVFPGPPKENRPMFQDYFLPWLGERFGDVGKLHTQVFRVFGLAESVVSHRLQQFESSLEHVRIAYQFHFPEILVKLRYPEAASDEAGRATDMLYGDLGRHIYGQGSAELPEVLGHTLASRGERIVTAESCTGGLVSKLLTDIPGSSNWFERGFVTYTNRAKRELLRVPRETLLEHGAVSEPVALAMLEGALERSDADFGVALTGVSGPSGGSDGKPVGTVCIAWGDRKHLEVQTHQFHWDRSYNRLISAWTALWRVFEMVRSSA